MERPCEICEKKEAQFNLVYEQRRHITEGTITPIVIYRRALCEDCICEINRTIRKNLKAEIYEAVTKG